MIGINQRKLSQSRKEEILEYYNYICQYCYDEGYEVDHIIPWNYIHDDSVNNLVCCCKLCNLVASDKVFDDFNKKRKYIQKIRQKMLDQPIPIWLSDEINEMSGNMKRFITDTSIIVNSEEEMERVADLLLSEGYAIILEGGVVEVDPYSRMTKLYEE